LEAHGISGNVSQWIAQWLQGRQQRVVLNGSVPKWLHVLSGVPQGSLLGPLLFIIFTYDMDNGIVNKLLKFEDDAKLVGIVSSPLEVKELQLDLQKMYCWSVDLQILFNADKCMTLHFGYNNVNNEYTLGNEIIKSRDEDRDLGVIISCTLKSSSKCVAAAKSANRILGMISRTFVNKNSKTMLKLYQSLVRN